MLVGTHDWDTRRTVHLLLGLWLAGLAGGSAMADDHFFVMRDGRKVRLMRSESELGVVFHSRQDAKAAAERVARSSRGTLEELPGGRDGRVKILHVRKVTAARRATVAQDPAVRSVGRVYRFATSPVPFVSVGRLAVKLRGSLSEQQRSAVWDEFGIVDVIPFPGLHDVYLAAVTGPDADEVVLSEKLSADVRVLWAHPDFLRVVVPHQIVPSDAFFEQQWHLNNTGQTENGTPDADIDAPEAWTISDGEGVLFGMADDSCDVTHEDLAGNYIGVGQDVLGPGGCSDTCFFFTANDDCDDGGTDADTFFCPFGTDCTDCGERPVSGPRPRRFDDFHGTNVMGLAVAAGNSLGVRGVSFRSRFTASGGLFLSTFSETASAYTFAMEQGVDVHINSWGAVRPGCAFVPDPPIVQDAIETAFLEGRDLDGPGGDEPLGMVIVFSAGNGDLFSGTPCENRLGFALSAQPYVLGVGASDDQDKRAAFSNFGEPLEFLAPGAALIATTDNEDETNPGPGLNGGGIQVDPSTGFPSGGADIDPGGKYTGFFSGTSASCPIVAGIAGLILSVNKQLTATDVRLILEHTCDQISPEEAQYNRISSHSVTYGYGRVNAHSSVLAAQESLTNGGFTWPDVPSNLTVIGSSLLWRAGFGASEFLVVKANSDFGFIAQDGVCYDAAQSGCEGSAIEALPENVSIAWVGCTNGDCSKDADQELDFEQPEFGRRFFAIFGRNSVGRYSFGVPIDSTSLSTGGTADPEPIRPPAVTITASPLEGASPLTVQFNGNAISALEIDGNRTTWDFDIDDERRVDATTPVATFTYVVPPGETRRFTALLTMADVSGNEGSAVVRIRVQGPTVDAGEAVDTTGIQITAVGAVGSDDPFCQTPLCGVAPLTVTLSLVGESSDTPLSVQSVLWDLGDGATATSQSVLHSYTNDGTNALVLPIAATITFTTSAGVTRTATATELITILPRLIAPPQDVVLEGTQPLGEGGPASSCGIFGMVPLLFCVVSLWFLRHPRS